MAVVLFTVSLRWVGWFLSPLPETSILSLVSGQGLARGGRIHCPSFEGGLFFCPCSEQGLIWLRSLFQQQTALFCMSPGSRAWAGILAVPEQSSLHTLYSRRVWSSHMPPQVFCLHHQTLWGLSRGIRQGLSQVSLCSLKLFCVQPVETWGKRAGEWMWNLFVSGTLTGSKLPSVPYSTFKSLSKFM